MLINIEKLSQYVLIHNFNGRLKKNNVNVIMSSCYKSLGVKNSLNTAIHEMIKKYISLFLTIIGSNFKFSLLKKNLCTNALKCLN